MTDRYARIRALLVTKYVSWEWHWRLDGTLWIVDPASGRVIEVGRVERVG